MLAASDDYLYKLFKKLHLTDFEAETARVLVRPFEVLLILVAAMVVARIGARLAARSVRSFVTRTALRTEASPRATARAETLAGVASSLVRIVIWTIAVLLAIDRLGVNTGPVLAGASIIGVAVGFGAQSLVKDFVSGFFVLAEDQFGVGDTVTVLDVTGTVEEVNLRVTRVRASDGTVWYIPNGEIRTVGNSAKEWSRAIVDVAIPSSADVDAASSAIAEEIGTLGRAPEWAGAVLEAPEVLGTESIGPDEVTLRVTVKTNPPDRARVARELRARIGARLRRDGIFPVRDPAPAASAAAAGSSPPEGD